MSVSNNKKALIMFLGQFLKENIPNQLEQDDKIYLSGCLQNEDEILCIKPGEVRDMPQYYSSQEEADTCMILHAVLANKEFSASDGQGCIIIFSPDTDLLIDGVHHWPSLTNTKEVWMHTGTSTLDHRRYIPIHEICQNMSPRLCEILPAAHALTGCDNTSSFYYIGKKKKFNVLQKDPDQHSDLKDLYTDDIGKSIDAARKLIVKLYDPAGKDSAVHGNLNKLRVRMGNKDTKHSQVAAL
jgi:hypothetical protein